MWLQSNDVWKHIYLLGWGLGRRQRQAADNILRIWRDRVAGSSLTNLSAGRYEFCSSHLCQGSCFDQVKHSSHFEEWLNIFPEFQMCPPATKRWIKETKNNIFVMIHYRTLANYWVYDLSWWWWKAVLTLKLHHVVCSHIACARKNENLLLKDKVEMWCVCVCVYLLFIFCKRKQRNKETKFYLVIDSTIIPWPSLNSYRGTLVLVVNWLWDMDEYQQQVLSKFSP